MPRTLSSQLRKRNYYPNLSVEPGDDEDDEFDDDDEDSDYDDDDEDSDYDDDDEDEDEDEDD